MRVAENPDRSDKTQHGWLPEEHIGMDDLWDIQVLKACCV